MSNPWAINAGKASTAIGTATIESDDNLLTITDHGLGDGDTVTVDTLTGGGSALTADAVYFVRDATTDDFALSLTLHGPQVEFATDGGADVYSWAPQYSASQLRRLNAGLMFGGTSDAFGVRQGVRPGHVPLSVSGTTWTVEDLTGAVYPGLSSDDGGYPVAHQEESGSLDPADGSNDRIDALDLQIQDDDEDASGFRRARVVYVTGTPGSGSAPSVTTNALRLGTILVPSGGSPSPSVDTLAVWTVASGGLVPVRGSSELPTAGRYAGMAAWRQDTDELEIDHDGAGDWRVPYGWQVLDEGSASGVATVSIPDIGGYAEYDLWMEGTLDDTAWLLLQPNAGESSITGVVARRLSDGAVLDSFHGSSASAWRIARWSTAFGCNARVSILNVGSHANSRASYRAQGLARSSNDAFHALSESGGGIGADTAITSLVLTRLSPSTEFTNVRWKLLGSR